MHIRHYTSRLAYHSNISSHLQVKQLLFLSYSILSHSMTICSFLLCLCVFVYLCICVFVSLCLFCLFSIRRELAEFLRDPPANCNAGPKEETNIYEWWSSIMGPEGSPYAKGIFFLNITFPEDYPFKPPKVRNSHTIDMHITHTCR